MALCDGGAASYHANKTRVTREGFRSAPFRERESKVSPRPRLPTAATVRP